MEEALEEQEQDGRAPALALAHHRGVCHLFHLSLVGPVTIWYFYVVVEENIYVDNFVVIRYL